jgi:hypothetical protein
MRLNLLTSFVLAAVALVAPAAGAATITQTFTQPQTVPASAMMSGRLVPCAATIAITPTASGRCICDLGSPA